MPSERKTESIVRRHFEGYPKEVVIEEQESEIPKIAKHFKQASKSGSGRGFPEFIITLRDEPNLVIVVECKAKTAKHCSRTTDRYSEYAVDGVLLYASYLSRGFDVLAIAVSGTKNTDLKISHFLHLKAKPKAIEIFGDQLLSPVEYISGYRNDPQKYRQDYESLQDFIRELNTRLHLDKVSESDRSLLISAALIALERQSFKKAYESENDPDELARMMTESVSAELRDAGVSSEKLKVLKHKFDFLLTSPILTTASDELKNIIRDLDSEVNSFIKNHQYRDVLGLLYIEFLRYANSDKGLGIVLTPPHITELFADLAEVNAKTIVYDNCAGTGGFLISALKKMISDAKGSTQLEKSIKKNQIFGTEIQDSIYPLAVSNMYIHQDGKSNIELGNCFDQKIIDWIKKKKPTVGMLNPPYKADKKRDTEELEFVLNNLQCLHQGGICVAIVPMQSALAISGKVANLKQALLRKHTLEAVCSMPSELFFNSKVGVVSCVMVFTAHRPHPKNKDVFLGYFKDDGFVKRKIGGRLDANEKWDEIRKLWIELYTNRRTVPGISVNVPLSDVDEWAAEAYMDTDYSTVSYQMFEDTLLNYSTYLFANQLIESASDARVSEQCLEIDTTKWQMFQISDLFNVSGSKTTSILELEQNGKGDNPYVTTQATNNGVGGFYAYKTEDGNVLTVDSAVVGYCSYQTASFSASDHVEILKPKFPMNPYIAMFLVTVLNMEQYRYNYGRKCSQTRLNYSAIKLPATEDCEPDYQYMEQYTKSCRYSNNI